ncbi:hypothetical protein C7M52_00011 [Mixta theicola]|nr:phage repressor protein CI [Mixta theicola]QHM74090.1 hypothetical protein C7M52_00011 [Mixta theicola]
MAFNITSTNEQVLDRICEVYGFHQKVQLARHFDIAASSLQNRYTREHISFDFAALCALETGASLMWILTGQGERFPGKGDLSADKSEVCRLEKFILSEGELVKTGSFAIDRSVISKATAQVQCIESDGTLFFVEQSTTLSDGLKLVDIDGTVSIREIAVLPGKKLHVTGGRVPFECATTDIGVLGRVIGSYNETN